MFELIQRFLMHADIVSLLVWAALFYVAWLIVSRLIHFLLFLAFIAAIAYFGLSYIESPLLQQVKSFIHEKIPFLHHKEGKEAPPEEQMRRGNGFDRPLKEQLLQELISFLKKLENKK